MPTPNPPSLNNDGTPPHTQHPQTLLSLTPPLGPHHPGILPVLPPGTTLPAADIPPTSNAATAASAAGVRALTSQAVAFYFRAPVKSFFRTRVDYLAYARALHEQHQHHTVPTARPGSRPPPAPAAAPRWTQQLRTWLRGTTPALLTSAIRHAGWRVVPEHVLPPLAANIGVGAVLYASYLQVLARLHPESGRTRARRVYPPPGPGATFAAGFVAGAVQSLVAAPLDAVQARWEGVRGVAAGVTGSGNPVRTGLGGAGGVGESMWSFGRRKLGEIGARGIFAGWGLSLLKDSLGSAVFFSTFEFVKAQGYYGFVRWYYGALSEDSIVLLSRKRPVLQAADEVEDPRMPAIVRPHYAIEPAFLLLAGTAASVAQQVVLHPLSHVQAEHWERLEGLDARARKPSSSGSMWRWYRDAYRTTWAECVAEARAAGLHMRPWLYRGFWWNTVRQVPSTSAGLIIFELVRRKYGFGGDQVRISRDGYDILLR